MIFHNIKDVLEKNIVDGFDRACNCDDTTIKMYILEKVMADLQQLVDQTRKNVDTDKYCVIKDNPKFICKENGYKYLARENVKAAESRIQFIDGLLKSVDSVCADYGTEMDKVSAHKKQQRNELMLSIIESRCSGTTELLESLYRMNKEEYESGIGIVEAEKNMVDLENLICQCKKGEEATTYEKKHIYGEIREKLLSYKSRNEFDSN